MSLAIERFTSSEMGAWSNSYLISGQHEAILFDVFMLREDTAALVDRIKATGKTLTRVFISHAHPDHFMGTEVIVDHFPAVEVISTPATIANVMEDGPWMLELLQKKLGPKGPQRIVVPRPVPGKELTVDGVTLEIVEFEEGESKHVSTILIPSQQAHITADLIYHQAHCYLAEKWPEAWLKRLQDLEAFCRNKVSKIYPGHGEPGEPAPLIESTRAYLREFLDAIQLGNAKASEERMLTKFPDRHARQFLSMFTIPTYFPAKGAAG